MAYKTQYFRFESDSGTHSILTPLLLLSVTPVLPLAGRARCGTGLALELFLRARARFINLAQELLVRERRVNLAQDLFIGKVL